MSSTTTIAFFGATGDCAGHCLAYCLKAGYSCIALARTPAKLTDSMRNKGVDSNLTDRNLTIVEGNAKDVESVKRALKLDGRVVDVLVSGIGGTPAMQYSLTEPVTLTDKTVCQDVGRTILQALQQLRPAQKPTLINVSTTGISPKGVPRDIPKSYIPLYKWTLHVPHEDKRILEEALRDHVRLPESERGISCYVNVKPTLLLDGETKPLGEIKYGRDDAPAIGWGIHRQAVALFMFERLIKPGLPEEWRNRSVSLTY